MVVGVKYVLITIGVVVLVVGIAVGGWQLKWWATQSAANHNAHIYQNSYGAQSADVQQVQQGMADLAQIDVQLSSPQTPTSEKSALTAQKAALVTQTCGIAENINPPLPRNEATFVAANC